MLSVDQFLRLISVPAVVAAFLIASQVSGAGVFHAQPAQGKRYFLYFGAVNYEAAVYLNGQKLGKDGAFKMVSSEERRPARWVRNLTSISVIQVTQ